MSFISEPGYIYCNLSSAQFVVNFVWTITQRILNNEGTMYDVRCLERFLPLCFNEISNPPSVAKSYILKAKSTCAFFKKCMFCQ